MNVCFVEGRRICHGPLGNSVHNSYRLIQFTLRTAGAPSYSPTKRRHTRHNYNKDCENK